MNWFIENWGTIVTLLAVLAVVAGVIFIMLRDKKQGRSSCGNKCAHCAMAGKCHSSKNTK